ncbi:MAG: hypothetical protein ACRC1H_02235, partial [Caldilineaceae bacterium]
HQKARRGEVVDVPMRPVTFHAIDLLEFVAPNSIRLRVVCSAGAYIRSLAVDIGVALGTVATLSALRREAAGSFVLSQAHTLEAIEAAAVAGVLPSLLLPPGDGLSLPTISVTADSARRLSQGQRLLLPLPHTDGADLRQGDEVQARDDDGRLLGILRARTAPHDGAAIWQPEKWLA